ncbi:glycosyltransferase family 4 protein [Algoriphagus sp. A40]|uniref:glycosyltransferase family 4 protein n=1 Tax=Algoriphagus sp. A40 TaxID=1945863 RepID=UPI000984A873|nr:glycosyltransferase family 4 protein [Algoriphagus sp. A40]OOG68180.1 hypothetical protein B0E43_22530 [Algoriphagus sp. A40]
MRILQILQRPQRRGAEIFAAQLAQNLTEQGHKIKLVYLFPGADTLPFKGQRIHLYASKSNRFWDMYTWWKIARLVRDFKPDIVQANAGDTLKYAGLSRFFFRWKTPLVFRNANLISGFMDSQPKRIFYRLLLSQVHSVASVSELCKQDFQGVFGWKKPIFHLPIGTKFSSHKLGLPVDLENQLGANPFLIHIGSFVPEKNHAGLLRIFRRLNKLFPSLRLVLCGDGPLRTKIEDQISPEIIILGSRQDINTILPHAKALLLPSLIEGLPGVILEAMASKVPVIAYDTGGVSEVVIHGQTGFLIPIGDESQFAETLAEKVLAQRADLFSLTENAFNLVVDRYSIESVSDQFEKFYLNLLNGSDTNSDS